MFVAANMLDRAAAIYIRSKNWTALRPIMPRVQSVQARGRLQGGARLGACGGPRRVLGQTCIFACRWKTL